MIDKKIVSDVLYAALTTGGDFAEIFVEDRMNTSIEMIQNKVEKALSGRDFGIGIRIFKGLNSVYTYTNSADRSVLIKAAKDAAAALNDVPTGMRFDLVMRKPEIVHSVLIRPETVSKNEKVALMRKGSLAAQGQSDLIKQVVVNYMDYRQRVMIANTEGVWAEDDRTKTRYVVSAVAETEGKLESGRAGKGAGKGFELYHEVDVEALGKEASRMALVMLDASGAPSGRFPVVIDNRFGGVIFHEACGHGLEATAVAKGNSVFAGKLGESIAASCVNAVDDGTIAGEWGSASFDDEGTPSKRNVLIENGILKGYMIDKLNARRMNMPITGSSRRQSYQYAPTSRMTNTYILNGTDRFEDMIASVSYGLYAKNLGGGSVNPATGEFNFSVQEGYLIEDGRITKPVKGATLIGTGLEILQKIERVGANFGASEGMCGSVSGSIPAGLGQPAIKVSDITIGGREDA
jgi:TldD protein